MPIICIKPKGKEKKKRTAVQKENHHQTASFLLITNKVAKEPYCLCDDMWPSGAQNPAPASAPPQYQSPFDSVPSCSLPCFELSLGFVVVLVKMTIFGVPPLVWGQLSHPNSMCPSSVSPPTSTNNQANFILNQRASPLIIHCSFPKLQVVLFSSAPL